MSDEPADVVTAHTREHLLTVQEFSELTRVHPLSVYRLIRDDKLPGVVRIGRHIRINVAIALARNPTHTHV